MYLALVVAIVITLAFFYRSYIYERSGWKEDPHDKGTKDIPGRPKTKKWVESGIKYWDCLAGSEGMCAPSTWLQIVLSPEGLLTLVLFLFTFQDVIDAWDFLKRHKWLSPEYVNYTAMNSMGDPLGRKPVDYWAIPKWVQILSVLTPLFMILTCVIVINHVLGHYKKCKEEWNVERKDRVYNIFGRHMSEYRDKSVQVILLPMVYAIMAFKSVLRMWKCFMNDFNATGSVFGNLVESNATQANFTEAVLVQTEIYETNYFTADLYEAWALWCFCRLTLKFLISAARRAHIEVEVKIVSETEVELTGATHDEKQKMIELEHFMQRFSTGVAKAEQWRQRRYREAKKWKEASKIQWPKSESGIGIWKISGPDAVDNAAKALHVPPEILRQEQKEEPGKVYYAWDRVITDPESLEKADNLVHALRGVTQIGVQGFVLCSIVAMYMAFIKPVTHMICAAKDLAAQNGLVNVTDNSSFVNVAVQFNCPPAWEASLSGPYIEGFLGGLGFFGSSIAIYNLIAIETSPDLHDYCLKFHPFWKFWGTKVLVSIAYLQSTILAGVNAILPQPYSEQQIDLIYSSLLVYELVGISILHYHPSFKAWHPDGAWLRTAERWELEYHDEMKQTWEDHHPEDRGYGATV